MSRSILALGTLALLLSAGLPAAAADNVAGTYNYVAASSDDVGKAIDTTIASMNFVVRAVARGRLEKVNQPYRHVIINDAGGKLSITTDDRAAIVVRPGVAIKWTRPEDGEKLDVTMRLSGGHLEETFASPDGKRVNVFTPGADGKTLLMKVTVTSPKLPAALTYKLAYKRAK